MKPYKDVLRLMIDKGFSNDDIKAASKQFFKMRSMEHKEDPDTRSPLGKAVTKYLGGVATGEVAKRGMSDIKKDLLGIQEDPSIALKYLGLSGIGSIASKARAGSSLVESKTRVRASHNRQDRTPVAVEGTQKDMVDFLDRHDYSYFIRKDGSVGVDVYDSAGDVIRESASTMRELRKILGY